MWAELIKVASLSKGALVVGVAASAVMVSNAEFSNAPSHHEPPSAAPVVAVTPATTSPRTQERHGAVPQVVKDCVDRYLAVRELGDSATAAERVAVGEVCRAALTATGLTSGEFWAKFGIDDPHKTEPKAEPKPKTRDADLEGAITPCLARYLAGTADQSDACRNAIAASGLSPQEFWTKLGPYAERAKHALSEDATHMAKECVTKYNARSADATATCKKAIQLSGLTSAEFAAKFLQRLTETKPSSSPVTTRPATAEFEQLVYTCRKLQGAITETATSEQVNAARALCEKAITASGMSPADFWNRWPAIKPPTKPAPTAKTDPTTKPVMSPDAAQLIAKCLEMYAAVKSAGAGDTKAVGEACNAAIKASGMNGDEFWARYHPATN